MLQPSAADIICVSALPPFAFAAAAKLCATFETRFPDVRIMAGIWGFPEDEKRCWPAWKNHPPYGSNEPRPGPGTSGQ